MFGLFRCGHSNLGWPRRHPKGHDYQVCLDCGAEVVSKVQFERSVLIKTPKQEGPWPVNLERSATQP